MSKTEEAARVGKAAAFYAQQADLSYLPLVMGGYTDEECVELGRWHAQHGRIALALRHLISEARRLERVREVNALLVDALESAITMWRQGDRPLKLAEALTWRQNDELAEAKAREALAAAKAASAPDAETEVKP